jgi:hypothetical protein
MHRQGKKRGAATDKFLIRHLQPVLDQLEAALQDQGRQDLDRLTAAREVLEDEYLERAMTSDRQPVEADGQTPAGGDPVFASAEKPPLLPFVSAKFKYVWAEEGITVRVEQSTRPGQIFIRIGAPPGGLEVLPNGRITHALIGAQNLLGDDYLAGLVTNGVDGPFGEILVPSAAKDSDAGLVWRKLLRSYRVTKVLTNGNFAPL